MARGIKSRPNITPETMPWLAGLLEGEGSFTAGTNRHPCSISVQMTDEDVIARVAALFGSSYWTCNPQHPHHKISYVTRIRGGSAIDIMNLIRPFMGIRRQGQIDRAIESWAPRRRKTTAGMEDQILKLLRSGHSMRAVGRLTGFSYSAVWLVSKRAS